MDTKAVEYLEYAEIDKEELNDFNIICDKSDCLLAVFAGVCAGIVDIFFVGTPEFSKLGNVTDKAVDKIVMKFAKMAGWKPRVEKEDGIASAIGFLERKFKVNYDQTKMVQIDRKFQLNTKNHHLKSLAHAPDVIGLFFSIIDQFTGSSSFISNGRIITINNDEMGFELRGSNFISKLYCGFCNWIGHVMSDLAGSSGNRRIENGGRGMGLPVPFMELFQLCDFGKLQGNNDEAATLARIMEQVFVSGYDARFAITLGVPVILQNLMIKVFWVLKGRFCYKKKWRNLIPDSSHGDLRIMLLLGNATLCLIDGSDAIIRSKGNAFCFIMHINIVAWSKLIIMTISEIKIRYGKDIAKKILDLCYSWMPFDAIKYYVFIENKENELDIIFSNFLIEQENLYADFNNKINSYSVLNEGTVSNVMMASEIARTSGVEEEKVDLVNNLDEYFNRRKKF